MKKQYSLFRLSITAIILAIIFSGCNFPSKPVQYTEFYVSVKGNDSTGDGSKSKPWRHIQHAINVSSAKSGTTLRINLLKGIYEEELVIHKPLVIKGVGIGKATTWANDPFYPQEEVSVITVKQLNDNFRILIENATSVTLQDLVVTFGGIRAVNTRFIMYNVEIPQSRGGNLSAVQIENCPMFYIEKSQIRTAPGARTDLGINIIASGGDILETYIGSRFDHAINYAHVDPDNPGNANGEFLIPSINIRDSEIEGSHIYFADGIRIQSPASVRISNTKITRTHADAQAAPAGKGGHNYPYAGIEIAGVLNNDGRSARVEISGVTIKGFNSGIGINTRGISVKAQNNNISGVTYDVETMNTNSTNTIDPVVDFGGGPLGSIGENNFAKSSPYAIYNDAPYMVYACFNEWNVAVTEIDPLRIFDKLDVGTKGRVRWNCTADIILITPSRNLTSTPDRQVRPSFTPTSFGRIVRVTKDALCFVGPGETYGVISAIKKDQQVELIGLGQDADYYVVANPIYLVPCWVQTSSVQFDGIPGELRIIPIPTLTPIPVLPDVPDGLPETITTPKPPGFVP